MNKFDEALQQLKNISSYDDIIDWFVKYDKESDKIIAEALSLASRIEPFIDELRELVAVGDKATQGEWDAVLLNDNSDATYIDPCEFASARTYNEGELPQEQIHNDAVFIAKAANLRPLFKAILGEE